MIIIFYPLENTEVVFIPWTRSQGLLLFFDIFNYGAIRKKRAPRGIFT